MTRIAAFVGDRAIVVASDGRAVDQDMRTVDDRARKIFYLSPLCLVLASGRAPRNMLNTFDKVSSGYMDQTNQTDKTDPHMWQAGYIAQDLAHAFNGTDIEWLDGVNQTFIIAGYDYEKPGFVPRLFALLKTSDGWDLHANIDGLPFMIAGDKAEITHKQVAGEIASIPKDTRSLSKYALRTIKQSSAIAPQTIGGYPGLWNIFPTLDDDMKRYMPRDILAL